MSKHLYLLLLLAGVSFAGEIDPSPVTDLMKREAMRQDHLYRFDRIHQGEGWRDIRKGLEASLCVTPGQLARMLYLPIYGGERCLSVYARKENGKLNYFITVTSASGHVRPHQAAEIRRGDRAISTGLAHAIHGVWEKALLGAKAEQVHVVDDGDSFCFSAEVKDHGLLEGFISSPSAGMTKGLIELEADLRAFAASTEADEKPLLEKVTAFEKTMPKP